MNIDGRFVISIAQSNVSKTSEAVKHMTLLFCALGFSLDPDGVDVRGVVGNGDAPPDSMLGI